MLPLLTLYTSANVYDNPLKYINRLAITAHFFNLARTVVATTSAAADRQQGHLASLTILLRNVYNTDIMMASKWTFSKPLDCIIRAKRVCSSLYPVKLGLS